MGANSHRNGTQSTQPQALKSLETACFLRFLMLGKLNPSMVSVTHCRHHPENSVYLISGQLKLVCVAYKILNKSFSFLEQTIHEKQVCTKDNHVG